MPELELTQLRNAIAAFAPQGRSGLLPALQAINFPLPSALNSTSPRMLRAELPVHSTSTL